MKIWRDCFCLSPPSLISAHHQLLPDRPPFVIIAISSTFYSPSSSLCTRRAVCNYCVSTVHVLKHNTSAVKVSLLCDTSQIRALSMFAFFQFLVSVSADLVICKSAAFLRCTHLLGPGLSSRCIIARVAFHYVALLDLTSAIRLKGHVNTVISCISLPGVYLCSTFT